MKAMTEDTCTSPWMPDTNSSTSRICTKPGDIQKVVGIYRQRRSGNNHSCDVPCRSLPVVAGGKTFLRKPFLKRTGRILLRMPDQVLMNEEKYLYGSLVLFAEIGGYVGILLGYSLLDLVDCISDFLKTKIKHMEEKNNRGIVRGH